MISASYPQLCLSVDALEQNIDIMARWCSERDVALAPHVKTTMSAPIIERQVGAGALGVTVATVDQAVTVLDWGHCSVLIANQVVDSFGLSQLRSLLADDPGRKIQCFVDSEAGVKAAALAFGEPGPVLEVLLDIGAPVGRTGLRDIREARRIAELVADAPGLKLVGVAGYEGIAPNTRNNETIVSVDDHCRRVRDAYLDVADLFETATPVFSMGGSAFPDRVVEFLPTVEEVPGTIRLLRSGCYVVHDHGTYAGVSPVPGLNPALTVRAVVLSAPEPGLVIIGAGKRDLPYDAGFPVLLAASGVDGQRKPEARGIVRKLYDHHAVLEKAGGLEVGDVVQFGISHPCSAFDRWSSYLVTDVEGSVVDVWESNFLRSTRTLSEG
ncbi:alanine racemase [Paenarthrobacter sp. NPDC056912]|uniref:alanine racemase n=1 Tax=Paenarthrobacter sp. NPDC056912 TaxID=3345965 RepID=UPI00366DDA5F